MLMIASTTLFIIAGILGIVFKTEAVAIISGSLLLFFILAAMVAHGRCISSFSVALENLVTVEAEDEFKIMKKDKMQAVEDIQVKEHSARDTKKSIGASV